MQRGETISPLSLLLWAPYTFPEDGGSHPRALWSLLKARCSPNQLGSSERAPLSFAVGVDDQESMEELLAHRADPNRGSEREPPPLCVAFRHRRRAIARCTVRMWRSVRFPRTFQHWERRICIGALHHLNWGKAMLRCAISLSNWAHWCRTLMMFD